MAQDELIGTHVSLQQCEKAIKALHSHQTKKHAELQESELLPGKEEHIWLNVTVKRVSSALRIKPIRMWVPDPNPTRLLTRPIDLLFIP